MTTSNIALRAQRTMFDAFRRIVGLARAFESRHRRLVDDLTAALVTILAVAAWYAAFALFAH